MAEPTQNQSVAQLLEQLLAVANQQLTVAQQTNSTVNALLASSKNIEKLLGGGEEGSIPAMLKVIYKYVMGQKEKKQ